MLNFINMSKFKVGQRVWLFNSMSMAIEPDEVYGVLYVPVAVEGVAQESQKSIAERLEAGQMEVKEQCQLSMHQGIVDAAVLFASEWECRDFYRKFFSDREAGS